MQWIIAGSLQLPDCRPLCCWCCDCSRLLQQDAGVNYDPATELDPVTGYPDFCAAGTLGVTCATSDELYNYGFPQPLPDRHDVALVVLDQPISLSEYGQLAEAGFLDNLATARGVQNVTFTVSGY